jgi:hypothetical protein
MRSALFCDVTQFDRFVKKNLAFFVFSKNLCIYAWFLLSYGAGTFWEKGWADMEMLG